MIYKPGHSTKVVFFQLRMKGAVYLLGILLGFMPEISFSCDYRVVLHKYHKWFKSHKTELYAFKLE